MRTDAVKLSPYVIDAINEELAYTASLNEQSRADDKDHGVAGQILCLEEYVVKARKVWCEGAGEEAALDELRKCAAIAILALERYGCPCRDNTYLKFKTGAPDDIASRSPDERDMKFLGDPDWAAKAEGWDEAIAWFMHELGRPVA